jgi:hypothetical protein
MVDTPTFGEKQSSNLPPTNSTTAAPYDGPEAALAALRYEFTTLPRSCGSSTFTLKDHPLEWPVITGFEKYKAAMNKSFNNTYGWGEDAKNPRNDHLLQSIEALSFEDNCAAKLLLVIFWATILDPKQTEDEHYVGFWELAGNYAHSALFDFLGAPEQYLGWAQNVKQRSKGSLDGVVSGDGQKFFLVTRCNAFVWISDTEGLELAKHVIGELPTLKLEFI